MNHVSRRISVRRHTLLFLIGLLSAAISWASVGGSISGTVRDPSGNVVPKTSVTVREVNTGLVYRTHTTARDITRCRFFPSAIMS
jgi:hypothetical protein